MPEPIWKPDAARVEASNVTAFLRLIAKRYPAVPCDFAALYNWSLAEPAPFWSSVWDFCGVVGERRSETVVTDFDDMLRARWFPDARLNYAANLLKHRDDHPALIFWNEHGFQRRLSYVELYEQVARLVGVLRGWGVGPGDRVAAVMPNVPETVVAMLATTALGAIWTSCSPDFGLQGLLDRFGQIQPKVLFAVDGYEYDGKWFDCRERVRGLCEQVKSIEQVVVEWSEITSASMPDEIDFHQFPFDHPLAVLYSSGTTGLPKCIVHRAGGILLQHLKEHVLHTDLKRDDRLFYFTTCGWMMWNWLVGALATGCTIVLYDGSPFAASPCRLFEMVERERITVFGTSPRFLSAVEKTGFVPRETNDLSSLRTILSTGAPLGGESFDFVYDKIKPNVQLASISGGTDLCSCFALGNPVGPVYRGEIQTRGLGMNVQVYDDVGRSVRGEKGELVCASPFPSMPLGFWNDPDDAKYRQAYFERFPGVWHHGDYAELTKHDGLVIYGRSDTVLNPGGVRIGTAEIYRQVEPLAEILECVAVAQEWRGDVRLVLFVKLRPGAVLDDVLTSRIRQEIRRNTTPRHVPAKIIAIADLPRTKSGKLVEGAVRAAIHNRPVTNVEALANPESLEQFRNLPELAED